VSRLRLVGNLLTQVGPLNGIVVSAPGAQRRLRSC